MDLSKLPKEFEVPPEPKEGDEIDEYLFSLQFKKNSQTESKEVTSENNSEKKVELADVLNQIKTIK